MLLLNVNDLEKSFGSRTLFQGVSFGLEQGEKVGLVGPNGVGKSTLAKILAGQISPDEGQVTRSQGLHVGHLDQDPQFKKGLTIIDAIAEKTFDPIDAIAKAYELLSVLKLDQFGDQFLVEELSGGWKKRVALARELILNPDLLILDEPTNHLDVSGILWLEEFLASQKFACLMITHDRLFLQRVCDRILDLDPRNPQMLLDIKGTYLDYSEAKQGLLSAGIKQEEVLKNKLSREKEWLSRGPQARQTKQKARIEAAGELEEEFDSTRARNFKRSARIDFGEASRLPKKLIQAKDLSKSFGGREIFSDFSYLVRPTTRLGILGENGSGKSTLIRCLLGLEPSDSGALEQTEGIKVSYFEQGKETLDHSKTVLKNVCPEGDHVFFQGNFVHVRSYLERFLFFSHHVDLVVSKLSGGEKARLRLAQLMLQEAQILVLDEPTNDLDTETLEVLEEALSQFHGAVLLVTHDRFFMDSLCDQILALPQMQVFSDYFQWESWHRGGLQKNTKKSQQSSSEKPAPKKMSFKDKFELENMEQAIASLEGELKQLEAAGDYKKMAEVQATIDQKFSRWAELEAQAKG